jgi:hypothetical protein
VSVFVGGAREAESGLRERERSAGHVPLSLTQAALASRVSEGVSVFVGGAREAESGPRAA